jgi:glycosyltransferase involved in cell wall biosynthesis
VSSSLMESIGTPADASADRPRLSIAMMTGTVGLGGAEMVVLQLTQELRARGHTVHPVVPLSHEGWLVEALTADGFTVHRYDLRRAIDATLPARLAAQLAALGVNVVHSHEFTMAVYGAAAAKRIGRPHVITMHANQTTADRLRRRMALRWAFKRSQTIAVSEDTRIDMEARLGLRKGLIEVIPNGIPEIPGDRVRTRQALGVRDEEVLLLSVGNLSARKAHWVLLEAAILLRAQLPQMPHWRIAIVGDGDERPMLEQIIRDNQLHDRVHLLGKRTDIPHLQAAADVFVLPSLWEGLPLAVLEAMFGGNPVIASDKSGIPEAVDHGVHGLLTPPGDPHALAGAIAALLRDPAQRKQMGQSALQRARSHFTIAAMTNAYEEQYYRGGHLSAPARTIGRATKPSVIHL